MDRVVNLLKYLPHVSSDTLEFQELMKTQSIELTNLYKAINRVRDEFYFETMTEYGASRLEKMHGIKSYDSDTLEDRIFRLKAFYNSELPYTIRGLRNMLFNLCGNDYQLTVGTWTMTVKIGLGAKKQFNEVSRLLDRVVPANFLITVEQLYNSQSEVGKYTHLQLEAYKHDQLRNEVFTEVLNANNN